MSFLDRLFGSINPSSKRDDPEPTCRVLLRARMYPWHRVPEPVIDAIFDALDDTELFDPFIQASMEKKLVPSYEKVGRESDHIETIRVKLSEVLSETGFREIKNLERDLKNGRRDSAKQIAFIATNLFEPAILFNKEQIGGYLGMAMVYELIGAKAESQKFAERGLLAIEVLMKNAKSQTKLTGGAFPFDTLDQSKELLHKYTA